MSLTKQIAKNTFYLTLGKIISTGIGVITLALLLRYLSPGDYGRYTTVLAFVLLFGTFVDFGLNLTTTQDISLPTTNTDRTISSIFTLRILINIVLVLLLPVLLLAFPYETTVKTAILIASVYFFAQSLFQILSSYFQKTLQAGKVALAEMAGRVTLLLTTLLAIYFNFSFLEIILTIAISSLVQLWALLKFTFLEINLRFEVDIKIWKRILKKTWPIALSVIFTTIYFKGDAIILSLVRPYNEVGIYGAAYKILEVLITIPILLMGLVLPHLSKSVAVNDIAQFEKIIQKTWDGLSIITIPLVVGGIVLANPIINLVAGTGYEDSAKILQILMCAVGIIFFGSLFTHAIVAINQQKQMIKYYAAAAIMAIVLYIIYIPQYTYYAAAFVTVGAELFIAIASFAKVRKNIKFSVSQNAFLKSFIASAIMAIVLYAAYSINIIALLALGAITYAFIIFITKTHLHVFYKNNR